jgi:hypothetical protein
MPVKTNGYSHWLRQIYDLVVISHMYLQRRSSCRRKCFAAEGGEGVNLDGHHCITRG